MEENIFFDREYDNDCQIILEECLTSQQNKLFKSTINKYHSYRKFTCQPTRNIRWNVYEKTGNHVGAIGLSSAVIAIKCRDNYIGWDNKTRIKNLGKLANNSRCCFIRNNFTIKNIGSMTLKQLRVVGAKRWFEKYNEQLLLLETFVQPTREEALDGYKLRSGSIYLADNWINVGITSGNSIKKGPLALWVKETGKRGELARTNPKEALEKYGYKDGKEYIVTKSEPKIMFIKPLVKNWKEMLLA